MWKLIFFFLPLEFLRIRTIQMIIPHGVNSQRMFLTLISGFCLVRQFCFYFSARCKATFTNYPTNYALLHP